MNDRENTPEAYRQAVENDAAGLAGSDIHANDWDSDDGLAIKIEQPVETDTKE